MSEAEYEDDGWHVLNCDGCGSPKSVEPEQKQYLCAECIRAYFDQDRLSTITEER